MSGGNRSSAVMQQKRPERDDSPQLGRNVAPRALNYFPTPPWATRALCEFLEAERGSLKGLICWEPACGEGHMVRPLQEYFAEVVATDVHRYGDHHDLFDFTLSKLERCSQSREQPDFVITNPPFTLAFDFIEAAAVTARVGFAMLVRSAFLEGGDRHQRLWSRFPPDYVLQFSERVVMLENRLIRAGDVDPFNAIDPDKRARSATSYCWLVWIKGSLGDTRLRWIGPSRAGLERRGDYPDYSAERAPAPAEGLFA
jgi:hypothetical protein